MGGHLTQVSETVSSFARVSELISRSGYITQARSIKSFSDIWVCVRRARNEKIEEGGGERPQREDELEEREREKEIGERMRERDVEDTEAMRERLVGEKRERKVCKGKMEQR